MEKKNELHITVCFQYQTDAKYIVTSIMCIMLQ